eukprot:GHVQ01015684.1.p1 GENE.GHVQ01015684.1~~GHVQ01015684.1.p1  ORF type:complete len:686 (-),score=75.70 GHVQ01015684.1:985-3042(-)
MSSLLCFVTVYTFVLRLTVNGTNLVAQVRLEYGLMSLIVWTPQLSQNYLIENSPAESLNVQPLQTQMSDREEHRQLRSSDIEEMEEAYQSNAVMSFTWSYLTLHFCKDPSSSFQDAVKHGHQRLFDNSGFPSAMTPTSPEGLLNRCAKGRCMTNTTTMKARRGKDSSMDSQSDYQSRVDVQYNDNILLTKTPQEEHTSSEIHYNKAPVSLPPRDSADHETTSIDSDGHPTSASVARLLPSSLLSTSSSDFMLPFSAIPADNNDYSRITTRQAFPSVCLYTRLCFYCGLLTACLLVIGCAGGLVLFIFSFVKFSGYTDVVWLAYAQCVVCKVHAAVQAASSSFPTSVPADGDEPRRDGRSAQTIGGAAGINQSVLSPPTFCLTGGNTPVVSWFVFLSDLFCRVSTWKPTNLVASNSIPFSRPASHYSLDVYQLLQDHDSNFHAEPTIPVEQTESFTPSPDGCTSTTTTQITRAASSECKNTASSSSCSISPPHCHSWERVSTVACNQCFHYQSLSKLWYNRSAYAITTVICCLFIILIVWLIVLYPATLYYIQAVDEGGTTPTVNQMSFAGNTEVYGDSKHWAPAMAQTRHTPWVNLFTGVCHGYCGTGRDIGGVAEQRLHGWPMDAVTLEGFKWFGSTNLKFSVGLGSSFGTSLVALVGCLCASVAMSHAKLYSLSILPTEFLIP